MQTYRVTDTAPAEVAGKRVAPGQTIELTERAARFELVAGHIEAVPPEPVAKAAKAASKAI